MNIIYVLIPIAMIFVAIAVVVFFWAVKSNQYDDLDREGVNILFDEDVHQSTLEKPLSFEENSKKTNTSDSKISSTKE
jgi:cbb3-type cytochrome oxidase maturation protein